MLDSFFHFKLYGYLYPVTFSFANGKNKELNGSLSQSNTSAPQSHDRSKVTIIYISCNMIICIECYFYIPHLHIQ